HWLAGHHAPFRLERGPRVPLRHRGSLLRIHVSTASPSAGIRALPVRQSSATCAVDTYVAPPDVTNRSNTIGSYGSARITFVPRVAGSSRPARATRSVSSAYTIATSGAATGASREAANEPVIAHRPARLPTRSARKRSGPPGATQVDVSFASNNPYVV